MKYYIHLPDGTYRAKWVRQLNRGINRFNGSRIVIEVFDVVGEGEVLVQRRDIYGYCSDGQLRRREVNLKFEPVEEHLCQGQLVKARGVLIAPVAHLIPD